MKKEALYYEKMEDKKVRCLLCPNYCIINSNKIGICRARKNIDGKLYAINYGKTVSLAMDPIEKKPLYHFYPNTHILSIAPNSCNLMCPFCQNAEISQMEAPTEYIDQDQLISIAIKYNSKSIAYTYTEPLTWYEYIIDTSTLAHQNNIKTVLVTNGMINEEPLLKLLPYIDAANIDLKSMNGSFYKNLLHGDLNTVLNTIRITKKHWHIEITNLVIPGYNDSENELRSLIDFIEEIGKDTVLHFSRYFPHYKFNAPSTPIETLKLAYKLAKEKLYYVYIGNVWQGVDSNTYCPGCKNLLVKRTYLESKIVGIENKQCNKCGRVADFIL